MWLRLNSIAGPEEIKKVALAEIRSQRQEAKSPTPKVEDTALSQLSEFPMLNLGTPPGSPRNKTPQPKQVDTLQNKIPQPKQVNTLKNKAQHLKEVVKKDPTLLTNSLTGVGATTSTIGTGVGAPPAQLVGGGLTIAGIAGTVGLTGWKAHKDVKEDKAKNDEDKNKRDLDKTDNMLESFLDEIGMNDDVWEMTKTLLIASTKRLDHGDVFEKQDCSTLVAPR